MMTSEAFSEFEKRGWSDADVALNYADGFANASEQSVPELVAQVRAGPGCRALDLCCGQGIVAAGMARAGAQVKGLDFSPAMLELARERVPGVDFVEGDAMNLPFEAKSFDAVTIGFGILHVPDAERALAEAHRVLRPGGRLAFSVWHLPTRPSVLAYAMGAVMELGDPNVDLPSGPGLFDYADPETSGAALKRAGFFDVSHTAIDSFWMVDDPDLPGEFLIRGTVRFAALLGGQPADVQARIRKAIADKICAEHGSTGPWRVPVPAIVFSATA